MEIPFQFQIYETAGPNPDSYLHLGIISTPSQEHIHFRLPVQPLGSERAEGRQAGWTLFLLFLPPPQSKTNSSQFQDTSKHLTHPKHKARGGKRQTVRNSQISRASGSLVLTLIQVAKANPTVGKLLNRDSANLPPLDTPNKWRRQLEKQQVPTLANIYPGSKWFLVATRERAQGPAGKCKFEVQTLCLLVW